MDYRQLCEQAASLVDDGQRMAMDFAAIASPGDSCSIRALEALKSDIGSGNWTDDDLRFLVQAIRGLMGVEGAQLTGLRDLFAAGPPVLLHPAVTLVRGTAEAGGLLIWLLEPWVNNTAGDDQVEETAWKALSLPVLARTQLLLLDAMASRRRRREALGSPDVSIAEVELDLLKQRLLKEHGSTNVLLTGGRKNWRLYNEKLPDLTDAVTAATEYSYGQSFRGTGMNPYPMLSGYAHASLDVVFAQAPSTRRPPMSSLLAGRDDDAHRIASLALRVLATTYEIAARAFGSNLEAFRSWEEQVEAFVLGSRP